MKLSRIALAMLVAAPLAAANAGVTVTPLMLGYTFQDTKHNNGDKHLTMVLKFRMIYLLVLHLVLN
jgi:OOP family OmpA-OmpF porin